jgi:probable F420-dependent oxidoreductase
MDVPTLGVKILNTGPAAALPGLAAMAQVAEQAGAAAAHVSDHVVLVEGAQSRYPFSADGTFSWPPDIDVYDPLVTCAWIAAHSTTLSVGPSVLVLPQRHPLEVAKTVATLDRLSEGRMFLGVGAGWLAEEFAALGQDFATRVGRMEESIAVLRRAWSGDTRAFEGDFVQIPSGVYCRPLPVRSEGVPIMLGGMSSAALRRAAAVGDGWIAIADADGDDNDRLRGALTRLDGFREQYHTTGRFFRRVARVVGVSADDRARMPQRVAQLAEIGFDEVAIDPGWDNLNDTGELLARCAAVLGSG